MTEPLASPADPAHRDADLVYARGLWVGTVLSVALIVAGTLLYLGGFLAPYIALPDLPALWGKPLPEFLAAARAPTGWGWLALAGRGDYVNFVGIALLGSVTMAGYGRLLFHYLARRDRVFAALVALQLLIMLAAASGLLNSH